MTRLHLEEDAGKSTHTADGSLVDYNRQGMPLIEIVSGARYAYARRSICILREVKINHSIHWCI
ncbi:hypothetical protein ACT7DF_03325 [Bacillus cereus]